MRNYMIVLAVMCSVFAIIALIISIKEAGDDLRTVDQLWENLGHTVLIEGKYQNAELWKTLERAAESIEAAKQMVEIIFNKTPFQFAQDSTRDAQNIKFTIDGQLVYLVGPGAKAALEELR